MTVSLKEMKKRLGLTPEQLAKIDERTQQLIDEELTLRELRKVHRLTQESMASLLGIEQDSVSRMERRADMLLSTMSSYVAAMGGRLRLVAEFPDRAPVEVKLSDLNDEEPVSKRRVSRAKKVEQLTPLVLAEP